MTAGVLAGERILDPVMTEAAVRRAALAAAGLTVASLSTLGLFYSVGEPWGTLNDVITIALAAATVPIALGLAHNAPGRLARAGVLADLAGVAGTIALTSLLIARVVTFEGSLLFVLLAQGLIGGWLVICGVTLGRASGRRMLAGLAVVGGAGLVATVLGFALGGISQPLTVAAGGFAIVGTIGFYGLLGLRTSQSVASRPLPGRP